jgi:nucleoside-diphosphate-sugar epimerase
LPLTVVRPAPLYGPGSDYGHGGIILTINRGLVPSIPKDSRNYITTSVHIDDMARFAAFIADKDFGLGEDYNVVDDSIISYTEFMKYLALLLGRRMGEIPFVNLALLRPFMVWAAKFWLTLEQKYKVPRVRVFEVGSATYMSSSYWLSNRKTKEAGFVYRYPDVREGMRDTVDWFRRVGWLDKSYNPKGIWMENMGLE